jgi:hypothetical protein
MLDNSPMAHFSTSLVSGKGKTEESLENTMQAFEKYED